MMIVLFVVALLTVDEQVISRLPGGTPRASIEREVRPDVVRPGSRQITVITDVELQSPVTVEIQPPDGIRVGAVKLGSSGPGASALIVDLVVASDARPGAREIVAVVKPAIVTSSSNRPGVDEEMARAMEALNKARGQEMERLEIGSFFVNTHDISITNVTPRGSVVAIEVSDARVDFDTPPADGRVSYGVVRPVGAAAEFLISELSCGGIVRLGAVSESKVIERKASGVVIQGTVDLEPGEGPCDLKVRARDGAGNTSGWYSVEMPKIAVSPTASVESDRFVLPPEMGRLFAGAYELYKTPSSGFGEVTVEFVGGRLRFQMGRDVNPLVARTINKISNGDVTSEEYRFTAANNPAVTLAFVVTKGQVDYIGYYENFQRSNFSSTGRRKPRP